MADVLSAVAFIPSAPVLVPELSGAAAAEIADLSDAVVAAVATLPQPWVVIGVTDADTVVGPVAQGTFAGYGVDVPVRLSPESAPVTELPLCALIAGWVRGLVAPTAGVRVHGYSSRHGVDAAAAHGRALRAAVDEVAEPVGVLVVADGLTTLTPPAPGGYDPDAGPVQQALDDAVATGDVAALMELPDAAVGRVAYQVAAGLIGEPVAARELYRGAPYGVGYFVGTWTV